MEIKHSKYETNQIIKERNRKAIKAESSSSYVCACVCAFSGGDFNRNRNNQMFPNTSVLVFPSEESGIMPSVCVRVCKCVPVWVEVFVRV